MKTEVTRHLALIPFLMAAVSACQRPERPQPIPASLPQLLARAEERPLKHLDIGFGSGPLNAVKRFEKGLRTAREDGFVHLRVLEPFKERDDDDFSLIIENLSFVAELGFVPMLVLSNYPYDQLPDEEDRGLTAAYPEAKRRDLLGHTNRYPPRDMQRYGEQMQRLFRNLAERFGREQLPHWYIEIGNEPDAPRFFWGSREEFRSIFWTTMEHLHDVYPDLKIGGAAFTAGLVKAPSLRPGYAELAREINRSSQAAFVSFHVYSTSFPDERPTADFVNGLVPRPGAKVISEWNVSTQPTTRVQRVLGSDRIVPYLIDMIRLCYEADVELLLIHKLMDDPGASLEQLGFFDSSGTPKGGYRYLKEVRATVGAGYTVVADSTITLIRGGGRTLVKAGPGGLEMAYDARKVIASSFELEEGRDRVPGGGWLIMEGAN